MGSVARRRNPLQGPAARRRLDAGGHPRSRLERRSRRHGHPGRDAVDGCGAGQCGSDARLVRGPRREPGAAREDDALAGAHPGAARPRRVGADGGAPSAGGVALAAGGDTRHHGERTDGSGGDQMAGVAARGGREPRAVPLCRFGRRTSRFWRRRWPTCRGTGRSTCSSSSATRAVAAAPAPSRRQSPSPRPSSPPRASGWPASRSSRGRSAPRAPRDRVSRRCISHRTRHRARCARPVVSRSPSRSSPPAAVTSSTASSSMLATTTREQGARLVLRSGCYLVHDHGIYGTGTPSATGVRDAPTFRAALTVWARVVSCPEPGLALLDAGPPRRVLRRRLPDPARAGAR